jgi:hypothetical protein
MRPNGRLSERVAINSRFKSQAEEVDRRGAGAHLLLVATKFSVVVAVQGVATTYDDAIKVSQSTVLFVSPPCPSAQVLTTLIAHWGRLG